jgi:hypothetical protein
MRLVANRLGFFPGTRKLATLEVYGDSFSSSPFSLRQRLTVSPRAANSFISKYLR